MDKLATLKSCQNDRLLIGTCIALIVIQCHGRRLIFDNLNREETKLPPYAETALAVIVRGIVPAVGLRNTRKKPTLADRRDRSTEFTLLTFPNFSAFLREISEDARRIPLSWQRK